jgi:two-component system KDP operon response regulator KdpE
MPHPAWLLAVNLLSTPRRPASLIARRLLCSHLTNTTAHSTQAPERHYGMNPKRILVVDDDAVILKALSMKLKAVGYEVLLADDGAAAVSAARQGKPDVILLDISFPPDIGGSVAWDGFLILGWLRRLEELKNTPVIMISQDSTAEAQERARAAGASDFCPKPLDCKKLIAAIEQVLGPAVPSLA